MSKAGPPWRVSAAILQYPQAARLPLQYCVSPRRIFVRRSETAATDSTRDRAESFHQRLAFLAIVDHEGVVFAMR